MTLQVQDGEADQPRETGRNKPGSRPRERRRDALPFEDPRRIGAETEERRGCERRIAGEPADEVPRQRQHRVHGEDGAEAQRIVSAEHEQAGDDHRADGENDPVLHSKPRLPNRPDGRTTRMRMSNPNDTVTAYSGPNHSAEKLSIRPSTMPPAMAPGTLPRPPSTQITKAL